MKQLSNKWERVPPKEACKSNKINAWLILTFEVIVQPPKHTFEIGFFLLAHCVHYYPQSKWFQPTSKPHKDLIKPSKRSDPVLIVVNDRSTAGRGHLQSAKVVLHRFGVNILQKCMHFLGSTTTSLFRCAIHTAQ